MDRNLLVGAFVAGFLFLFVLQDFSTRVFYLAFIAFIIYFVMLHQKKLKKKSNNVVDYIDKLEKTIADDSEIPADKIFYIHKTPRNLKLLKNHKELLQTIYDLKYLNYYNRALYIRVVSYIEYFLKVHYKIMLGKYDHDTYYSVLKDIRKEILNLLKTAYFDLPKISTITDIPDVDVYTEQKIKTIQAITFKLLKIVNHKYNKEAHTFPSAFDKLASNKYDLFV